MKREVLCIENLYAQENATSELRGVSINIFEGEIIGLLGLIDSGKNLFVNVLCGICEKQNGNIYIFEKKINEIERNILDIYGIYRMTDKSMQISGWTIAEYILILNKNNSRYQGYSRKAAKQATQEILEQIGLSIDVNTRIGKLSRFEKLMVNLARAISLNAKIIIIEDDFEGVTSEDILMLKAILIKLGTEGITFIINSNSYNETTILAEKYIIFKQGIISKKCTKSFIEKNLLEDFMVEKKDYLYKKYLNTYYEDEQTGKLVRYRIIGLCLKSPFKLEFSIHKGEVISLIDFDVKEKEALFDQISVRDKDNSCTVYLDGMVLENKSFGGLVDKKVVSIKNVSDRSQLLSNFSIGENLVMPSLHKVTSWLGVITNKRINKVMENQIREVLIEQPENINELSSNDCIIVVLERWYIFKPKVLILLEPFLHCDMVGISLIKEYIKKFSVIGTTVIIIASKNDNTEEISNRTFHIEQGRII